MTWNNNPRDLQEDPLDHSEMSKDNCDMRKESQCESC